MPADGPDQLDAALAVRAEGEAPPPGGSERSRGRGDRRRGKSLTQGRRRWMIRLGFLLPAAVAIVLFRLVPTVDAFRLSLTEWTGLRPPEYIGFDNFQRLIQDPVFFTALRNNLIILAAAPVGVLIPLTIALILNTRIWGWRLFRAAFFLPAFLSPVVVGIYFAVVLAPDGPLNVVLRSVGLDGLARGWLGDFSTALPSYILVMWWAGFGVGVLIFMARLGGLDPDLTASARVDGASWFQIQTRIIIPQLRPTIMFWSVLSIILIFTAQFPLVFTLTGGGPGHSTNVLEFLIYRRAFTTGSLGLAAALGVVLFAIVAVVALAAMIVFRRLGWNQND